MRVWREVAGLIELVVLIMAVWAAIIGGGLALFWLIRQFGGAPA